MRYESPTNAREAVAMMASEKGNAHLLAGGTDLLVRMRGEFIDPDLVVDIKRLPGVLEIRKAASGFSIGAGVPCAMHSGGTRRCSGTGPALSRLRN